MKIIDALREVGKLGIRATKLQHRFHREMSAKEFWDRVRPLSGDDGLIEDYKVGKMRFLRLRES